MAIHMRWKRGRRLEKMAQYKLTQYKPRDVGISEEYKKKKLEETRKRKEIAKKKRGIK